MHKVIGCSWLSVGGTIMKQIISLLSLLTASITIVFFFFMSNKQPLRAQGTEKQRFYQMAPDTMPAAMFKDYVIDLLEHEDPKVFDFLTPLMLMATKQHKLARKVLRHEVEITDGQYLTLRSNPVTEELALMIDIIAQGQNVTTACKKLLPTVSQLPVDQTKNIENHLEIKSKVKKIAPKIKHIVIVPDGDRRWARERSLDPSEGHRQLAKNVPDLFQECWELGIHTTTLSLTSTETAKREIKELETLFLILNDLILEVLIKAKKFNVKMIHLGRKDRIPAYLLKTIQYVEEETKNFQEHIFNFAVDYGGKYEIVQSIEKILSDAQQKGLELKNLEITEDLITSNLNTSNQPYPNPDFVIRTGKEQRLSGFMSWQAGYSELYFPYIYFPDFNKETLYEAIINFGKRERRFGK